MKTVHCTLCPATFTAPPTSSRKTCDSCRKEIRRMQMQDYDKRRRPRKTWDLVCEFCSDPFQWSSKGRPPKFCPTCRDSSGWLYEQTRSPRLKPATKRSRSHYLRYRYGMTNDRYAEMLAAQGGGCAICGEPPTSRLLHVDHDHSCCSGETSCGKCVRGLLCRGCNQALGHMQDDPARIRRAAEYLERNTAHVS